MAVRIAVNGFGRIGRAVYRILSEREDVDVVAINDLADDKTLAYLLRFDTVMGIFRGELKVEDGYMVAGQQRTRMLASADPSSLPWKEMGVDIVVEATGRFRSRKDLESHLVAGAKRVILTVPPKDEIDNMIVIGVNEDTLKPDHRIVSNASCTTNCLAPIAKVIHENFGIVKGIMTTVHAYTNDQRLADVPHSDFRRSRAAAENIIPTTTGAARAVGKVIPGLKGRLDGMAIRVPVPDGSIVDFVAETEKPVSIEAVNEAVRRGAEGRLKKIVEYTEEPIVSSDVIGNTHSAIFDSQGTHAITDTFLKTLIWYDNEWGYSCRVADLIDLMAKQL